MNLWKMLSFWKMKDMILEDQGLVYDKIYETGQTHVVRMLTIHNNHEIAKIIYRCLQLHNHQDCNHAFVYADILFKNYSGPDEVFIKNASLTDIRRYFIENSM